MSGSAPPFFDLFFAAQQGLDPRAVYGRAGGAVFQQQNGVFRRAGANTPRPAYDAASGRHLGFLFEPARVERFRNPLLEGGVVGGALPANVTYDSNVPAAGVTRQVVGFGTLADGRSYLDIREFGTATVAGSLQVRFNTGALSLTAGQLVRARVGLALVGGSWTNFNAYTHLIAGVSGIASAQSFATPTASVVDVTRAGASSSTGSTSSATGHRLTFGYAAGPVDATVRFVAPSLLLDTSYFGSPIWPVAGATNSATTRNEDSLVAALADWGIVGGLPQGSFVFSARTAPGIDGSAQQGITLDDGSSANSIRLTRETNRTIRVEVRSSGISRATVTSVASVADSTDLVAAFAWDAATLEMSLDGAVVVSAGLANLPAGLHRVAFAGWGGPIARAALIPRRISSAALMSASA